MMKYNKERLCIDELLHVLMSHDIQIPKTDDVDSEQKYKRESLCYSHLVLPITPQSNYIACHLHQQHQPQQHDNLDVDHIHMTQT